MSTLGIFTNYSGSSNFYIADNYFIGRDDPKHLLGWIGAFWAQFDGVDGQKFPPVLASYTAVRLYGPGHVVAYNYVANFQMASIWRPTAIRMARTPSTARITRRENIGTAGPCRSTIYNNYMTNFHDNAFEIDGSMHNVRVMRNMMVNSASHPFCNQPAIGGPIYWIRNIAYHAPGGSTRMTNGAAGVLFYNNTILTETTAGSSANVHWRNNLMLGENSAPAIFSVNTNTNYSSSDYNGFRPNPGAAFSFQWNSPPWNVPADYSGLLRARPRVRKSARRHGSSRRWPNTAAPRIRISTASRWITTSSSTSRSWMPRISRPFSELYKAEDFDFRLKPGSAAMDRGMILHNVTDGFTGAAPDLGALELGQPPPHYGPRNETSQEDRMDTELTGRTAELMLRAALGDPMTTAMYEGLCAGNAQSPVRGVASATRPPWKSFGAPPPNARI